MDDLKDIFLEIEKLCGKGNVILGNNFNETVPILSSTGSLGLDIALGCGGIPKGRIIQIAGPSSSGKCLVEDTYIATSMGYKTIKEIFNEESLETFCITKTTEKKYELYNKDMNIEDTTHFTHNGRRCVYRIITKTGNVIKGTANHPLMVMSKIGNLVWKDIKNITENDYVVCQRKEFFGKISLDNDITYAIGLLLADGSFQKSRISVTNDDPDIQNFIENKLTIVLNTNNIHKYKQNNTFDYHFNNKEMVQDFYKKYGFSNCIAKEKSIPKIIRECNKESLISFIQGYMDSESYCDSERGIEVTSASYDLLFQLKLILSQFKIISFLSKKTVKSYEENNYWRLSISGQDCLKYINIISSKSSKVLKRYNDFIDTLNKRTILQKTNHDTIPNLNYYIDDAFNCIDNTTRETQYLFEDHKGENPKSNISKNKLVKIVDMLEDGILRNHFNFLIENDFYFDKVKECNYLEDLPTFDFSMEKTHSFIANTIISHNTTMSLHCMREAQLAEPDKYVGFIDVEFSFDREWATKIGVNVEKLVISQPDCGEDALTIAENLIKSKKFSLIVIDSVGGLVTRAMAEGSFGDSFMAQVARLLSIGLPKINRSIKDTGTSLIFINQLRSNIGGYGNPEVRMGGKGIDYASSIILDTRRREVIGDKESPIGFQTDVKVSKNKCGSPYKVAHLELYIGPDQYGIDNFSEIVDIAVENGIIQKGGSWFRYSVDGNEERWQGKQNVIQYLKENYYVFEEIQSLVYKTVLKKEMPVKGSFASTIQNEQNEISERPKRKSKKEKEAEIAANFEEIAIVPKEVKEVDAVLETTVEDVKE